MKKLLVAVVILCCVGKMFAIDATAGIKGNMSISGNTLADGGIKKMLNSDATDVERSTAIIGGGFDVFFRCDFINININDKLGFSFGVQPEVGMHIGWGANQKGTAKVKLPGMPAQVPAQPMPYDFTFKYNTLDIPLMLVAGLDISKFNINVAVGPNFGFILGKAKMKTGTTGRAPKLDGQAKVAPFLMGMQTGLGFAFNLTEHHGFLLDARAIFDFMPLILKEDWGGPEGPVTKRVGALISLGYAYKF